MHLTKKMAQKMANTQLQDEKEQKKELGMYQNTLQHTACLSDSNMSKYIRKKPK